MVRPRMVEQCLPEEGATPQRDAGTTDLLGGASTLSDPALREPSCNALGRPLR
ncbi:hypothetical protein [Nitrosovibrio sp. Nv6]|uniref:hypothetical protein n=1 Tax=Nitrosovibrio sp. Nv6 TaxID=1855340 RepID=UPI001314D06C|nr:hypothetical protein [Nitrosovibrio sp. Nv6]